MRTLSPFDAQFLAETGNTLAHYTGITILGPRPDGTRVTRDDVIARVEERIADLAPLRWRIKEVPLGLDHPVLVECDPVVGAHVSEIPAAAPGGDRELGDVVARILEEPLPRTRPLWRIDVVTGLAEGRTALLTTLHHAIADGVSAAVVFGALVVDHDGPVRRAAPAVVAPSARGLLARGVRAALTQPVHAARTSVRVLPHLDQSPSLRSIPGVGAVAAGARAVDGVVGGLRGRPRRASPQPVAAPRSRFNGPLSRERIVAFGSVPVEVVKDLKNHHGVTFNDVVIAAVAGGLRRRMEATGGAPEAPLVAFVPTSVRGVSADGTFGNAISSYVVPIPTHEADGGARIRAARRAMLAVKERHEAIPTTLLADTNALIPPALFGTVAGVAMRLMDSGSVAPPVNLTVSNVPGPPVAVSSFGHPVVGQYPASLIFGGVGLNVTVVSYAGALEIGMVGDRGLVPDLWDLVADVREELAALHAAIT